jgi:hypothetical protein
MHDILIFTSIPHIKKGAAAAWVDTVELLGSGNVSVADVLGPAIRMAEEGLA